VTYEAEFMREGDGKQGLNKSENLDVDFFFRVIGRGYPLRLNSFEGWQSDWILVFFDRIT
jgi:hypothetical protein